MIPPLFRRSPKPTIAALYGAVVESSITANGKMTATCRGTFVAVRPGHPAYHRW